MTRRRVFLFVVLLSGTALPGNVFAEANYAAPSVITVGKGGGYTFKTIADALEYAVSGDVVLVAPGTYKAYKPKAGVVVKPTEVGGVSIVGSAGGWDLNGDDDPTAIEKNVAGVGGNLANTDDQIVKAIQNGETGAWNQLEDFLSGKVVTKEVNKTINKGTNAVTGAIDDTMDEATDAVMDPIEDAVDSAYQSVQCAVGGSVVAGVGSFATAIFGGGKATLGAQVAQWSAAAAGNLCLSKQLAEQRKQLAEQRKMNASIKANAAKNVRLLEQGAWLPLGGEDEALYGGDAAAVLEQRYQLGMPEGWTFDDAADYAKAMKRQTSAAAREAAAAAAAANYAIGEALDASDEALALSQGAVGQKAASQAQTQMLRAQITVDAAKHASATAA